jgi:tetratricopeptide (TPR) repeat protein
VFDEMMRISRAIGNEEMVGLGLSAFGMILSGQGDLAEARERDEKAIAIFHRTGSKRREAMTSANLARVDQRLGETATARTLYQSAALALGELGDRGSEARVLANEAGLLMDEGDLQPAAELSLRALSLHRAIGGATDIAEDRGIRGRLLHLRGDLPAAEREVTAAVAGLDALGARLAAARQRIELARILIDAGRPAEAKALAETALAALGKTPSPDDEVEARAVNAAAALALGRNDTAEAEARQAVRALAACENRPVRLAAQVVAARVKGAFGSRRAVRELRAIRSEAEQQGLRPLAFEARLALGALDGGAGTAAGRRELSAVLRETSLAGLGGIARRAFAALRG